MHRSISPHNSRGLMATIVRLSLAFSTVVLLSPLYQALAQPPASPSMPKVVLIYREEVKPGKGAAHEKVEVGWPQAFAKANYPVHYLAMTSMAGQNEAWFLEGYDSFASIEKADQAIDKNTTLKTELEKLSERDGELLSGMRTLITTYRDDLSYRPNVTLSQMRYMTVMTMRVRLGHDSDFVAMRKIVNAGHEKANIDEHWAIYQVVSGAPAGTYLLFLPMKSMAQMDAYAEIHGKPYQDALGEENQKKVRELASTAVMT
ncbi:MAG: hypothetical protein WBW16_05575, partial [Bacteroidota bacterium]